jgi:Rrf2 family transcriptional regulator, nitric oxide-sensitive transcriptional repressor
MQLKQFTDYALRVLLFVGRESDRSCTMAEIAAHYRISLEHLRKVVHRLAQLGYLKSTRGRGGGIALGRSAAAISVGEVVVAMEGDLQIIDCEALECVLMPGCSLKRVLDRATRVFIAALSEVTLADLLDDRQMRNQFRDLGLSRAGKRRSTHR